MTPRTWLRFLAERMFNVSIYRVTPRGVDTAAGIRRAFPSFKMATVFDIVANVGQSAERFLADFPEARILSFEQLQERFRGSSRVSCFNYVMSDHTGPAEFPTSRPHPRRVNAVFASSTLIGL